LIVIDRLKYLTANKLKFQTIDYPDHPNQSKTNQKPIKNNTALISHEPNNLHEINRLE